MSDSPWTIRGGKAIWQKGFLVTGMGREDSIADLWTKKAHRFETEAQQEYDSAVRAADMVTPDDWELICEPPKSCWEYNLEGDYEMFRVRFSIERKPKIDPLAVVKRMQAKVEADLVTAMLYGVDPAKPGTDRTGYSWHLPDTPEAREVVLASDEERKRMCEEHGLPTALPAPKAYWNGEIDPTEWKPDV